MSEEVLDSQPIFEDITAKNQIGIVWRVNVVGANEVRERRYSWAHNNKQKSNIFHKTRTDATEALRAYHKLLHDYTPVAPRPSMDQTLMQVAKLMADRATCSRAQVGAVIVVETRVVSSGYNGTAARLPHCDHSCDCTALPTSPQSSHWKDCRSLKPCDLSVHAEANAIAFAAKYGVSTNGATLYTTMAPCVACAKLIVNAGIVRVVAASQYRDDSGTRLLNRLGVDVHAELL